MNELVNSDRGVLVPYKQTGEHNFAKTYKVDPSELEAVLHHMVSKPIAEYDLTRSRARAWFEQNDRAFRGRLLDIVAELVKS